MNSKLYLLLGLVFAVLLLISSMAVSAGELPSKTSLDPKAKTKCAEVKDKNAVNDAKYNQGYRGYPGDGSGGYPGGGHERPREYGGRRDDQELPPEYGGPGGGQGRPPVYGSPGGGQAPSYGGPGGGQAPVYGGPGSGLGRPPIYGGRGRGRGRGRGCYHGYCGYRCCNAAEAQAQAQPQN